MVYLQANKNFLWHKSFYNKKGIVYTKYYEISNGQLLTLCEAVQKFDLSIDEIINYYPFNFIKVNRKYTVRFARTRYLDVKALSNVEKIY